MTIIECPSPEPPGFNTLIANKTFTELREPLVGDDTSDH